MGLSAQVCHELMLPAVEAPLGQPPQAQNRSSNVMTSWLFISLFFVLSDLGRDVVRALQKQRSERDLPPVSRMLLLPDGFADRSMV